MSKKGKDTPTSTRIRDNQRRSRERRAELISSLQERVREYEARGVQATLEMQRAARKVAQENVRLRSLLEKKGVRGEEVEGWLRACEEEERVAVGQMGEGSGCGSAGCAGQDYGNAAKEANGGSERRLDTTTTQTAEIRPTLPRLQPHLFQNHATETQDCPSTQECFCPPTATTTTATSDPGLEISCEAAATIIAEMRGEGDRDRQAVREALGCKGEEECRVRNSEVLGILGER